MDAILQPLNESKKRVCYFFDGEIGNYHYAQQHPMKPHRIKMTHSLVMNYGLYKRMEIYRAKPATRKEMAQFHTDEYVDFLSKVTPDNMDNYTKEQTKFNVGDDCPIFDGLFEYCSISAGGSMEGAARLSRDKCDIAINWAGGLHHGKKAEASGFCYINDIVLGILELLRYHQRVLYIDIDVHHGDGVEEAFYTTDRVMTCSFHKYGEFFPGTGELRDIGHGKGKHYAVNFPLRDGITDESYKSVFQPVIKQIMDMYQPGAVVLQCGSDSLSGDRLGCFNLSMKGHAECVQYVKSFGLPLLLLGGGGYTIRNVSRTWAYETGLAAGVELGEKIPLNEYMEYFGPTYRLDVPCSNMEDMNTREYLEKIKVQLFENLKHTAFAPSVQMQSVPRLAHDSGMEIDEDELDPDSRRNQWLEDQRIQSELEHAPTIESDPPAKRQKSEVPQDSAPSSIPSQPTASTSGTAPATPVETERATTTSDAPTALSASTLSSNVPAAAAAPENSSSLPSAAVTAQVEEQRPGETSQDTEMGSVQAAPGDPQPEGGNGQAQ